MNRRVLNLPGSNDELFTLGAGIGVEIVSHDEEHDLSRHVAVGLILTRSGAQAENQENKPGHADLEKHLEVENTKHARVQFSSHEEVIDEVASHAMLLSSPDGREVSNNADDVSGDNGDGHERAELINGSVQRPETTEMKTRENSKGKIQAGIGVAEVRQLLIIHVWQLFTMAPDTRQKAVECTLEDEVGPVPKPSLGMWESAGVDEVN